jgi:peptide-methionine (S)-S-oxide reductase
MVLDSRSCADRTPRQSAEPGTSSEEVETMTNGTAGSESVTLGGGCFWCLEAVFDELTGVVDVVSGYAGGHDPSPTYSTVCAGSTGHAEVVQVTFDPSVISFRQVLEVFFSIHDPTTPNRQGNDVGTQYRSAIFFHSPEQEAIAKALVDELERESLWDAPVVTEIAPIEEFHPAEEYHHEYFRRNPDQPYCQVVVGPKVAKFRQRFVARLKG